MADILVKQAGIGFDGDCKATVDMSTLRDLLKMEHREFDLVCAATDEKRADVEKFFQISS